MKKIKNEDKELKAVLKYFFQIPFIKVKEFLNNLIRYLKTLYFSVINPDFLISGNKQNSQRILSPSKFVTYTLELQLLFVILYFFFSEEVKDVNGISSKDIAEYLSTIFYVASIILIIAFSLFINFVENLKFDKYEGIFSPLAYTFTSLFSFNFLFNLIEFNQESVTKYIFVISFIFQIHFYYRIRESLHHKRIFKIIVILISIIFITILVGLNMISLKDLNDGLFLNE